MAEGSEGERGGQAAVACVRGLNEARGGQGKDGERERARARAGQAKL